LQSIWATKIASNTISRRYTRRAKTQKTDPETLPLGTLRSFLGIPKIGFILRKSPEALIWIIPFHSGVYVHFAHFEIGFILRNTPEELICIRFYE